MDASPSGDGQPGPDARRRLARQSPPSSGAAGDDALPTPLVLAIPIALGVCTFAASGRLGFNPSDEGLILAQARRIAHGAVPHADLFSPRPLGSALLHIPELALPFPLIEGSRWIATFEFIAIAWLLGWLALRRAPCRWTFGETAGVAAAFVVNLNAFPLMAWHTLDGILFVAIAWLALASLENQEVEPGASGSIGSSRMLLAGISLGFACLIKQSFAPAVLLGIGWTAWHAGRKPALILGATALVPPLLYLGWVGSAGGISAMLHQMSGTQPVFGAEFITHFSSARTFLPGVAALAVGGVAGWSSAREDAGSRLRQLSALALGLVLLAIFLSERLRYSGGWSFPLFWMALAFAVARRWAGASPDSRLPALLVLAWMVALSWGNATANLVAGSLAHTLCVLAFLETNPKLARPRTIAVASLLVFLGLFAVATSERRTRPYFDRPASRLTETLRDVSPAFGGIRTQRITAAYLRALVACVRAHPARYVAILPDNAALYPILDLENPFATDWLLAKEVEGAHSLFVDRARRLSQEGNYLVLGQTIQAFRFRKLDRLPDARHDPSWFETSELGRAIAAQLDGTRITCGPFSGIHRP